MCGIAGYFVTDPRRVTANSLQSISRRLLLGIENRGRDATGFAYVSVQDKSIRLVKAPIPASTFLDVDGHTLAKSQVRTMPRMMILHTRAATQGSPMNNQNNHPIYSKRSALCMVHNGWISNDMQLLKKFELDQDAEVDSEVYLRLIEHNYIKDPSKGVEYSVSEATAEVTGSMACAMIQGGRTDSMWVWRGSGMLTIGRTDWGIVFASTKDAVIHAVIGGSRAFDGSLNKVIEPTEKTLYTIKLNGDMKEFAVKTPEPDFSSGYYTVWVNGKQEKRAFPTKRRYLDDNYDGEWEGYPGYPSQTPYYHGGHSSYNGGATNGGSSLPGMAHKSSYRAYNGTQGSTDKSQHDEDWTPPLPYGERFAWQQAHLSTRGNDCGCRLDYWCMQCRTDSKEKKVTRYYDADIVEKKEIKSLVVLN